ncbi:MAG: 3-hydroxyacyl-CoA dehydrogenase NAD-binding domain-containing protein [Rubrivivax sp.]|nr:3-hydroxyacyl-CoA dehydrogenase NAD-binding domain-containing protein [Rubrivivax sp.]
MQALKLTLGDDGILVAAMDLPGRSTNVVCEALLRGIVEATERLADAAVKGLVLTSAKADFCTGGDIDQMFKWTRAEEAFEATMAMKQVLRALEKQGKPVVAAINGHALGGGLELALACHARFALDDARLKIGQLEVKLGLLPGGGGTVRLSRLLGIQAALQICAEGAEMDVHKALGLGLLTGLAKDQGDLLAQAKAWCLAHPKAQQPWDAPKFRFPGGDSRAPAVAQMFAVAPSVAAAKSWGNYPAVQHVMSAIFEGGLLDFEAASVVESRYLAACAMSRQSRNMIGTLWYQLNALKKGASRPTDVARAQVAKLGVVGAGMMGAGIAHVAAQAGVDVVLIDTSQTAAEQGKAHTQALLDRAVKRGRSTAAQRDAVLARITPTADYAALAGCELVIEAVFEDRDVKAAVTRQAEAVLAPGAVLASNTSTLPITGLAQASRHPPQFIGLHFFSPVEKMPLVEIIVGKQTSDETLARAFDFVRQIGKTPIVVNDSRGFYTSRVFATYVMEGITMLAEGVHPRSIEVAGLQAGMPMPPLALQDEVSLGLSLHVAEQTKRDLAAEGRPYVEHPGMAVVRQMCAVGRLGKKVGQGFYDWTDDGKALWPGLARHWPVAAAQPPQQVLMDRLMFAQANEAARCYQEGVLRSVADANIGSIFGWGFAPFHGGALQFINAMGAAAFVARSRELAAKFGPRFVPAEVVVNQAERGGLFVDS